MAIFMPEYELSFNNREDVLKLPVPPTDPPEFFVAGNNQTWTTTDIGAFMAIGHPGLMGLTLTSFFPAHDYPFCTYHDFPTPIECKALLEKWQNSKRPIRLIITGLLNEAFAIEELSFKPEIATGDLTFSLTLQRYRFDNGRESNAELAEDNSVMTLINLKYGQTLCELAEYWLGDSDRWKEIVEWNNLKDWGYLWKATEKNHHQLWIKCKPGEPGYRILKEMEKKGHGYG